MKGKGRGREGSDGERGGGREGKQGDGGREGNLKGGERRREVGGEGGEGGAGGKAYAITWICSAVMQTKTTDCSFS